MSQPTRLHTALMVARWTFIACIAVYGVVVAGWMLDIAPDLLFIAGRGISLAIALAALACILLQIACVLAARKARRRGHG